MKKTFRMSSGEEKKIKLSVVVAIADSCWTRVTVVLSNTTVKAFHLSISLADIFRESREYR